VSGIEFQGKVTNFGKALEIPVESGLTIVTIATRSGDSKGA